LPFFVFPFSFSPVTLRKNPLRSGVGVDMLGISSPLNSALSNTSNMRRFSRDPSWILSLVPPPLLLSNSTTFFLDPLKAIERHCDPLTFFLPSSSFLPLRSEQRKRIVRVGGMDHPPSPPSRLPPWFPPSHRRGSSLFSLFSPSPGAQKQKPFFSQAPLSPLSSPPRLMPLPEGPLFVPTPPFCLVGAATPCPSCFLPFFFSPTSLQIASSVPYVSFLLARSGQSGIQPTSPSVHFSFLQKDFLSEKTRFSSLPPPSSLRTRAEQDFFLSQSLSVTPIPPKTVDPFGSS